MSPFFLQLTSVATVSRGVTAAVGLFVALLAYRGYRQTGARKMRALAIGIGLLTTGVFLAVLGSAVLGASDGVVLLNRGIVTVIGLSVVLYALLSNDDS